MGNPVIRWLASLTEDVVRQRRAGDTAPCQDRLCGRWWQWHVALIVLLLGSGLSFDEASAAERPRPFRIGALTESWGPTPPVMGLRDGLRELGYRLRRSIRSLRARPNSELRPAWRQYHRRDQSGPRSEREAPGSLPTDNPCLEAGLVPLRPSGTLSQRTYPRQGAGDHGAALRRGGNRIGVRG
jgi:hypothetical protein